MSTVLVGRGPAARRRRDPPDGDGPLPRLARGHLAVADALGRDAPSGGLEGAGAHLVRDRVPVLHDPPPLPPRNRVVVAAATARHAVEHLRAANVGLPRLLRG